MESRIQVKRPKLETEWLRLTRQTLPALARQRDWPVRLDHCFMRILLDAAYGVRWDTVVIGRPAYKCVSANRLAAAIELGKRVEAGSVDLVALNTRSLVLRGKGPQKALAKYHRPIYTKCNAIGLPPSPTRRQAKQITEIAPRLE